MHKPSLPPANFSRPWKGNTPSGGLLRAARQHEAFGASRDFARFREATKGMDLLSVLRECLRGLQLSNKIYGPLSSVIMREYTTFMQDLATGSDTGCQWMTSEQLQGSGYELHQGWSESAQKIEAAETLQSELREVQQDLANKKRRVKDLEESTLELKEALASKTMRISELESTLEQSREDYANLKISVDDQKFDSSWQDNDSNKQTLASYKAKVQELEFSLAQAQGTISEQIDQKNVLEDRIDFIQDLLRSKLIELAASQKTISELEATEKQEVKPPSHFGLEDESPPTMSLLSPRNSREPMPPKEDRTAKTKKKDKKPKKKKKK
eukprot:TRINITY_DN30878_c0_g1_i1.p1 TRINITY_DN30878_c0_g1~~TRINITY_DN30878_c0_g1_i1.p1  ORF type:complete len:326 (+),score=77.82 TRINITY_DN30878_c0_g1_i1:42-1019(+)